MGTNFYLMTKNKSMAQQYAPYSYMLTDYPMAGYEIHVAKTSGGWLPLFQAHKDGIRSIKQYKEAYNTGEFEIYDEYGDKYSWEEFDERVLQFNGGRVGIQKPEKVKKTKYESSDKSMPDYTPISHIPGSKQSYKYRFSEDTETIFTDRATNSNRILQCAYLKQKNDA